jgi:hypothetical protein
MAVTLAGQERKRASREMPVGSLRRGYRQFGGTVAVAAVIVLPSVTEIVAVPG